MSEVGVCGKYEAKMEVIESEKVNKMRGKDIRWILIDNQNNCRT